MHTSLCLKCRLWGRCLRLKFTELNYRLILKNDPRIPFISTLNHQPLCLGNSLLDLFATTLSIIRNSTMKKPTTPEQHQKKMAKIKQQVDKKIAAADEERIPIRSGIRGEEEHSADQSVRRIRHA